MTYQIQFLELSAGLVGVRALVFNGDRLNNRFNAGVVKPSGLMVLLNELRREFAKHGVTEAR